MYLYSRLFIYACLGITLFIGGPSSVALPHLATPGTAGHWQLHTFDGHLAPGWVQRPATLLLPELRNTATGVPLQSLHQPQVGTCEPSLVRRLLCSAHLIPTLLTANDRIMRNELRYLHLLEQLNSYEISGSSLRLYDAIHPAPRLIFVRVQR